MHTATKERAVKYMLELINRNKLQLPMRGVNIDNSALRKKYFGKDEGRRKYYNARDWLKEVGILTDVENQYYLNGVKSYEYHINYQLLLSTATSLGIKYSSLSTPSLSSLSSLLLSVSLINGNKKLENVRFGKCRIRATDEEIIRGLIHTYPQLIEYAEKVERLNKQLPEYSQIKLEPTIHRSRSGICTKIGIRATNPMCNFPTLKKHPEIPEEQTREYFLENVVFGEWESFDVTGSVPTIARFIATGEIDLTIDPYLKMIEHLDKEYDIQITRREFKRFFMRLYFGGSSKQILNQLKRAGYNFDLESVDLLKKTCKTFCRSTDKCSTEVFLHESLIYIDVLEELLNRDIRVVSVYDEFFFRKGTCPRDFKDVIVSIAKKYRQRSE